MLVIPMKPMLRVPLNKKLIADGPGGAAGRVEHILGSINQRLAAPSHYQKSVFKQKIVDEFGPGWEQQWGPFFLNTTDENMVFVGDAMQRLQEYLGPDWRDVVWMLTLRARSLARLDPEKEAAGKLLMILLAPINCINLLLQIIQSPIHPQDDDNYSSIRSMEASEIFRLWEYLTLESKRDVLSWVQIRGGRTMSETTADQIIKEGLTRYITTGRFHQNPRAILNLDYTPRMAVPLTTLNSNYENRFLALVNRPELRLFSQGMFIPPFLDIETGYPVAFSGMDDRLTRSGLMSGERAKKSMVIFIPEAVIAHELSRWDSTLGGLLRDIHQLPFADKFFIQPLNLLHFSLITPGIDEEKFSQAADSIRQRNSFQVQGNIFQTNDFIGGRLFFTITPELNHLDSLRRGLGVVGTVSPDKIPGNVGGFINLKEELSDREQADFLGVLYKYLDRPLFDFRVRQVDLIEHEDDLLINRRIIRTVSLK